VNDVIPVIVIAAFPLFSIRVPFISTGPDQAKSNVLGLFVSVRWAGDGVWMRTPTVLEEMLFRGEGVWLREWLRRYRKGGGAASAPVMADNGMKHVCVGMPISSGPQAAETVCYHSYYIDSLPVAAVKFVSGVFAAFVGVVVLYGSK